MKHIAILGSTGSIGTSALQVVNHLKESFQVAGIAAHSNIDLLEKQAKEFNPEVIAVFDEAKALELQKRLPGFRVVGGLDGLKEVASLPSVELVISAIVGTAGLLPTVAAIEAGKDIALANKEVLVAAGGYVTSLAKQKGVKILPVDSEHSALFQCMQGERMESISRLVLTASGGPFRTYSQEQLEKIQVSDALAHPTWQMGAKVTIDSSTLLNKGLELIEAYWLFDIPIDQIDIVVHPQSIIHSMVEYSDGALMAQMSAPTMILPIQYAMTYPERQKGMLAPFDFRKFNTLQFFEPDMDKFICLKLARDAIKESGTLPCFLNAANEVLVSRFIKREISWLSIGTHLQKLMERHQLVRKPDLEDILAVDAEARREAELII